MPIKTRNDLAAEEVRQLLEYDPQTGILRWRRNTLRSKDWNTRYAGRVTGCLERRCHCLQVRLNDTLYLAHRLAWLIVTGEWPTAEIDHINGDRADNRWDNLREATRGQNMFNRAKLANNTSGFPGVRFRPHHGKWEARITVSRKTVWRAYALTAQEAAALRREALPKFHGEFVRKEHGQGFGVEVGLS